MSGNLGISSANPKNVLTLPAIFGNFVVKFSRALVKVPILKNPGAERPSAIPPRTLAIVPNPAKKPPSSAISLTDSTFNPFKVSINSLCCLSSSFSSSSAVSRPPLIALVVFFCSPSNVVIDPFVSILPFFNSSKFASAASSVASVALKLSLFSFPLLKKPVVKVETTPPSGPNVSFIMPSTVVDIPSFIS